MAEYNRFISYIYLYERGIKTINTGFAKVESRGGQCRINVMMKNMYHESHVKFSAYMFVRKGNKLVGIYLGDLKTENNTGEFDKTTDTDNIEGTGYGLEQVAGMIIRGDNGKIYGTGWDDDALNVDAFVPLGEYREGDTSDTISSRQAFVMEAENNSGGEVKAVASEVYAPERSARKPSVPKTPAMESTGPKPPVIEQSAQEKSVPGTPAVKVSAEGPQAVKASAVISPERTFEHVREPKKESIGNQVSQVQTEESKDWQTADSKAVDAQKYTDNRETEGNEEPFSNGDSVGNGETLRLMAESMGALARNDANVSSLFHPSHGFNNRKGNGNGLIRPDASTWQNSAQKEEKKCDTNGDEQKDKEQKVKEQHSSSSAKSAPSGDVSVLDKLIDKGLRMYPFEDDQVVACVRMEPQDIGMLPMKYWQLAGNSFLLHGYFSYRHLVLAKMGDGQFILGIPGVNYQREQFMAGMFGFDAFKPVRNHVPAGNEFGYWYMELEA